MLEPGPQDYSWSTEPEQWSNVRFDKIDILYVSPFVVRKPYGLFDLDDPALRDPPEREHGDLERRLHFVIDTARKGNPKIKILAQQFWGENDFEDLRTDQFDRYARSVATIVRDWQLDGYDVDYEWRFGDPDHVGGNVIKEVPEILSRVRARLDELQVRERRPLYVTITAGSAKFLDKSVADVVDFVNIQSYDGGRNDNLTVARFLDIGFRRDQLLWGILPENAHRSNTIEQTKMEYTGNGLAGIHLWRLNSHNAFYENQVQTLLYDWLHGVEPVAYDPRRVEAEWKHWDYWSMVQRREILDDRPVPKEYLR